MRSVNICSYKTIAYLNGYDDAMAGCLYDDEKEFCKDAYASGFSKGLIFSDYSDSYLPWNLWRELINGRENI